MKTQLTNSQRRRSKPVRRFNIVPLLAIVTLGAIGATLVLLFPMDWVQAPKVTVNAERQAVSPNGDGNLDTVPIMYSLSTEATTTVEVLDSTRSLVRTLVEEELQASGQHTVVWDGLDRLGQVLPDGTYFVRVTAQATVRRSTSSVQVEVDTQPPVIRLANIPEDMQVGGGERELLVEGVTDPDATVWLNDQYQPLEVTENGSFSVHYKLQEGENRIELVAVDEAGNRSSVVRQIDLLAEPPEVTVLNPPDGLWINERMLSVQGKVPQGIQVTVNQREVETAEDGSFNVDVVLEEGENLVRIEAVDGVGNSTVEERRVYLRTTPPALSLTTVREGMTVREPSLLVVGHTEPKTSVWLNGREVAVDSQGGFQSLVDLIEGENVIRAEAVGRAGNTAVLVREVTYAPEAADASIPSSVRTVLAATGAGLAGLTILWLVSGLWQRPLSLDVRVARPSLTPGANGWLEPAVVVFELSRSATVTAEVWDASNRHVDTVLHRQRRDRGEHLLVWDGRSEDGELSPPGPYEVEVKANTLFTTVSGSTRVLVEEEALRSTRGRMRDQRGQARYR